MTKVLVIGASGSLAKYVIDEAEKSEGIELTLFVRKKNRLEKSHAQKHNVIEGDALNLSDVKQAVAGQDIVYINLAGNLRSMGTNIVQAMKDSGVKRVIAICSIGIYDEPVRSIISSYRALADVIEASDLDYTILRPDWFTYDNEINYVLTHKGEPEIGTALSRRSIASFVVSLFENPSQYFNENLGISKPE